MRRYLTAFAFVFVLSWCLAPNASAQEIDYNCGTYIGISILGNSGQAPIGVNAWHDVPSARQFPCDAVYTEVETWLQGLSAPSCHAGWNYGNVCQHINFYMYPHFGWAEAQANYGVVGWGLFTGKSKNYLIRRENVSYAGYYLRQWDGTTYRDFGQPPPPPPPPDGEPCQMDPETGNLTCEGGGNSPIILNIGKEHKKFTSYKISSPEDGVFFDLNADGTPERLGWPEKNSELAFLALDRNGNGVIDDGTELFGNFTVQGRTNGFSALQILVNSNGDGSIDAQDPGFANLLLWVDDNRNGLSEPEELSAASTRVVGIGLGYFEMPYVDKNGNEFRFEGGVVMTEDAGKIKHKEHYHDAPRPVYDVFLSVQPRQ